MVLHVRTNNCERNNGLLLHKILRYQEINCLPKRYHCEVGRRHKNGKFFNLLVLSRESLTFNIRSARISTLKSTVIVAKVQVFVCLNTASRSTHTILNILFLN
jgi:hypothetical protein